MEKRISFFEYQSVKAVAKAIDPKLREQQKIKSQIEKLAQSYKNVQREIDDYEVGIVKNIGFHVSDLVKKEIETSQKNGKEVKVTKYVPTDIVSYDSATKQYIITVPDEPEAQEEEMPFEDQETPAEPEEAIESPAQGEELPWE